MNIGDLTATLGCDSSGLRRAEGDLRSFGATADSTFSNSIAKAAELAAAILTVGAAVKAVSDAISYGMRVETLGVAMNVVAKNAGVSADAIKYFMAEVKSAGVTSTEASSVITKALVQGLDLNKMKDLATRARDIAVVAGLNTSDTFATIMHGIESGMVRTFHMLGIAVREQKVIHDEYAASIGKTGENLNQVEKAQSMLNEVMRASERYTGAAAAADETAGKQLASLDRVIKDTQESFWALFGPGMTAGIKEMTKAFKDLQEWANLNRDSLTQTGISIGQFIVGAGEAAISAGKWLALNSELVKSLAELYIISKAIAWIEGFYLAITAAGSASVLLQGVTKGLIPVLMGAATTSTVFAGGATGMATAMTTATAAGAALNAMMITLLPSILAASAALAVFGAYKTMKGQAGYTSPEDPWQYLESGAQAAAGGAKPSPAPFVGPPVPPQSVLEMNKLRENMKKWQKEAEEAAEEARKKSAAGSAKGGGKGAESAEQSMKAFIESMNQETARAAGDTEVILNAWYGKQLVTLQKWAAAGLDTTDAKLAVDEAYYSKLRKLDSDFNDYYIAGMGKTFEALYAQEDKKLKEVAGNAEKTAKVREVFDKKWRDAQEDQSIAGANLFKGYLDTMASLSPVMADQLGYKRQALDLEIQLAQQARDRQLRDEKITQDTYDQATAMAAVVAQDKKFKLEMEHDKGLGGWAWGRAKEADQRNSVKDMMSGLESGFQNAFSSGLQGVLAHDQNSLKKIGQTMFQGLIGEITKGSITRSFDSLAKMIRPTSPLEQYGTNLGGGQGVTAATSSTGAQLSQAAAGLNKASAGFNLNTAQFGLAAGGLALSGIGIMTNSQALAMAGSVLQLAALAIQVYEALSATDTAVTMTAAAAALTESAVALNEAAFALAVGGLFHAGGVVAHKGLLVAHDGLNLASDERHVIARVGEGILQNAAMDKWARAGVGFNVLNDPERLPVIPMVAGRGGGGNPIIINVNHSPTYLYRATESDYKRDARMIVKAINQEIGNRGQKIGDGRH